MTTLPMIERSFALDDIAIRAGGSGRTVIAYAAVFDAPYEVRDHDGHYFETIRSSAFNRVIQRGDAMRAIALYNHGFILNTHTPTDRFSMPLGRPEEIRADGRGLLTVTEYAKTPLADEVLELIRAGAITAQSFRGPIYQSTNGGSHEGLRVITRTQLGISDYGPSPTAIARDAEILGVRSHSALLEQIADLDDEERAELLAQLSDASTAPTTPVVPPDSPPASTDAPQTAAAEAPPAGPSLELIEAEQAQRRRHQAEGA